MFMRNAPAILLGGIAAASLLTGCSQARGPYLSELAPLPPVPPTTAPIDVEEAVLPSPPATRPLDIAPRVEPEVAPATLPATAPIVPATLPAATAEPATAPATGPAVPATMPAEDLNAAFLRELADVAAGGQGGEPGSLPGPATAEQRTVNAILQGISDFRDRFTTSSLREAVPVLLQMSDRIRSVAPLQIPSVALCKKVEGFGVYEIVEPRFAAGREFSVVVYCEVEGFSSRIGDRATWETRLNQELKLVDKAGNVAWQDGPNTVVDTCRNRRRDFYVGRVIRLPATLPAGRYTLKVRLTDQISREPAESAIAVELLADEH